jgi:hypothetical protein
MPFAIAMEDVYHYGIKQAIFDNGYEPIRIDQNVFTGDILEQIKQSISASIAVVVDLSGTNPNVHVELGYAWGKDIPTILLMKHGDELCFDLRGQRYLVYHTIKQLQTLLTDELARLKASGALSVD